MKINTPTSIAVFLSIVIFLFALILFYFLHNRLDFLYGFILFYLLVITVISM